MFYLVLRETPPNKRNIWDFHLASVISKCSIYFFHSLAHNFNWNGIVTMISYTGKCFAIYSMSSPPLHFSNLYNNVRREVNRKKCEPKEVKLLAEKIQLVIEPQN